MADDKQIPLADEYLWARVRDRRTDKPFGTQAHIVAVGPALSAIEARTLCGKTNVSADATLTEKVRCSRCKAALQFRPDVAERLRDPLNS